MHASAALSNGLSDLDIRIELERRRRARERGAEPLSSRWLPTGGDYVNRERQTRYSYHHENERLFVQSDSPRYALAKGGEGGGKSVAGIIKVLERLRRGMSGIMGSPDFEHFKRSLWPEFSRWCPWQNVIAEQRYRSRAGWEPTKPFTLVFNTGASLYCGGFDDPSSWEGPNVSFAHIDEARRKKDAQILKVLDGRVRIPGKQNESPQIFLTTTPAMNWLYEYFGPPPTDKADPYADFKRDSLVIDLLTRDNAANLSDGFVDQRRQSLTEAEARVLLEAAWEDIETQERFLESMSWWDACREALPPLDRSEPIVLAADAGISSDIFALVGVSRHPLRHDDVAVRLVRAWVPNGNKLDFDVIEGEIRDTCTRHNVVQLAYDPFQLHQMMTRILNSGVTWADPFSQWSERLTADKQLLDLIVQRRIAHDGNAELRQHVDNADRKVEAPEQRSQAADRKLFICKRTHSLKIDLVVALSMAAKRCLDLNI